MNQNISSSSLAIKMLHSMLSTVTGNHTVPFLLFAFYMWSTNSSLKNYMLEICMNVK